VQVVTASGAALDLRLISLEPIPAESLKTDPREGVEAAITRFAKQFRFPEALLILVNPAQALGEEHMAHAQGCGLLAIETGEGELCWDAALAKGLPIYGLRDELRMVCRRVAATSVLSALAFGVFDCRQGAELEAVQVHDDRNGVAWSGGPDDLQVSVILREGYEVHQANGPAGQWRDRGNEGVVRLRMTTPSGAKLWSQPRFIMPGAQAMPQLNTLPESEGT